MVTTCCFWVKDHVTQRRQNLRSRALIWTAAELKAIKPLLASVCMAKEHASREQFVMQRHDEPHDNQPHEEQYRGGDRRIHTLQQLFLLLVLQNA